MNNDLILFFFSKNKSQLFVLVAFTT